MKTKKLLLVGMWSLLCFARCTSDTSQQSKSSNPEPSASLKVAAPDTSKHQLASLEGSEYVWGKKPCTGVNRSTFRSILVFLPSQVVRYVHTNVLIGEGGKGKEQQIIWEGTYKRNNSQLSLHFTQITQLQKGFDDEKANQTQQEKIDKTIAFKAVVCDHNRSALQNLSDLLDPEKGGNWVRK